MPAAERVTEKVAYERRRPDRTSLYEVVRDNLETLYGAIGDGALDIRVPKHAKKELEAYLDCGLLCRLRPDGLVRISLKRTYADGTVAVDMDPLSLLCRLAASVPPPRFHTVKYAGVLAPASPWRSRIGPRPDKSFEPRAEDAPASKKKRSGYRPWADLLRRTFGLDVLACPTCNGRMKLVAMLSEPKSITRFLQALGEHTDVPARSPSRGPPYWRSTILRRKALGEVA